MANEFLFRTPTSAGNRRVWTWSAWIKHNLISETGLPGIFSVDNSTAGQVNIGIGTTNGGYYSLSSTNSSESSDIFMAEEKQHKDYASWINLVISVDTTKDDDQNAVGIYVNGVKDNIRLDTYPGNSQNVTKNHQSMMNFVVPHIIGAGRYFPNFMQMQMFDLFIVDGQALTPDVFGFYKSGKGYISSGSSVATDFRPGQWVPKSPRIIKAEINRRGGFGVNGVYIPMNDSNNFGADFHGTPNSIIKLQENLPQPKCRIDGTGDYTGALRDDPFKQYLVLALPFVSNGLQNGFGDYSAAIRGSGSPISLTNAGVSIASTAGYYGSAAFFNNANTSGTIKLTGDNVAVSFGTGDWTVESWIFPTQLYDYLAVITTRANNGSFSDAWHIGIYADGKIAIYSDGNDVITSPGAIKVNQWTHIAAVRKNNNLTFYVNGVAAAVNTNYTKNLTRTLFGIGQFPSSNQEAFSGYIQDLRVYKGVAKYKGGFDVPKPYTPVGISTWRAVPDTTANNFNTLTPLKQGLTGTASITFSNGNLTSFGQRGTGKYQVYSSMGFNTGRWYAEVRQDVKSGVNANNLGIVSINLTDSSLSSTYQHTYYGYGPNANRIFNVTPSGTTNPLQDASATYAFDNGDIISIAADLINNRVYFAKNGVWLHTGSSSFSISGSYDTSIPSGIDWCFGEPTNGGTGYTNSWNFGQNPTFSGNTTTGTFTDSNGKGLFKYQPPAGFLALCEDNLPKPTVEDPGKHFKTVLWTGSGTYPRNISGVGFTPDLVWVKNRNVSDFHRVYDSVRGVKRAIYTNSTQAEQADNLISFDSDGFSFETDSYGGGINDVGEGHVAWCWKAGNTTQTNTSGSITSVVSVNQDAGFSIVSWTGAGTNTVGHGLGRVPAFIIMKARNEGTASWAVYHKSIGPTQWLQLNSTSSSVSSAGLWNNTSPTSSVFTIGSGWGTYNYITYCWAEIEGFSKFGSYVGNGSTDGPFVYCGFKPAWVMIKPDGANGWVIMDNARKSINPNGETIFANTTETEYTDITNRAIDFLSNGFKIRAVGSERNSSGVNYIFVAFAEAPFQTANAK